MPQSSNTLARKQLLFGNQAQYMRMLTHQRALFEVCARNHLTKYGIWPPGWEFMDILDRHDVMMTVRYRFRDAGKAWRQKYGEWPKGWEWLGEVVEDVHVPLSKDEKGNWEAKVDKTKT